MSNLVIGASLKPFRYSNMAVKRLREKGHEVKAIGLREGKIEDVQIDVGQPQYEGIDTVLLYLNAKRQEEVQEYILSLQPRRIIFNPGTENQEFQNKAEKAGIETIEACSLVMLSTGMY